MKKIFVAGHNGMVGKAVLKELNDYHLHNYDILTVDKSDLNLLNQEQVFSFLAKAKPDIVIICAARVGGIKANMLHPYDFLYENLTIQNNLIHGSFKSNVSKVIFLASSCIYPRNCSQPMMEDYLFDGKLEPTNEGYAIAKLSGIKLLEYLKKQYNFNCLSLIPCNLYGKGDSFDLNNSHVISALIKKIVDAKYNLEPSVEVWGTGSARREFMNVSDMAKAVIYFTFNNFENLDYINIGVGDDISIYDLAHKIKNEVNFEGEIIWDTKMPDGMPRKCLDVTKMLHYGFSPKISLDDGIVEMISNYKSIKNV